MGEQRLCTRTARRLTRLFRMERRGRFDRLPAELAQNLIDRRGSLILELQQCSPSSAADRGDLDRALRDLAQEVDTARAAAEQRRDELTREIRSRARGSSGLRGGAAGQLLGRG